MNNSDPIIKTVFGDVRQHPTGCFWDEFGGTGLHLMIKVD